MPKQRTRVLIADDDRDTRVIWSDYLTYHGYETIVAPDGEQALALATAHPLDLARVDVVMPGPAGIELIARLKEIQPQIEVILITAFGSTELAVEALHRGAFYYLNKPLKLARLLEVVEEARAVQQVRERALAEEALEIRRVSENLTRRELQMLALLAAGMTDPEIARTLLAGTRTVNTHASNLSSKLGVRNRVQAAVLWKRCRRGSQIGPKNT